MSVVRILLAMILALALAACQETVGADRTQPFAATSNPIEQARGKIQQTCTLQPSDYFGIGTSNVQERCTCYASGVVKLMNKDELDYYANYGLIPTLSKDKYEEVKKSCAAATGAAPNNKPQKKNSKAA